MALPVEVKVQAVPHVPVHLVKRLSCAFAQSPRSPRPYRISQSIWFPLSRLKHPFLHAEALHIHGHCPASPLLWPHPTPRFAFAIARPPKFLTELSRRVVLLCPAAPARPKPIRALGVGFTASELLAARNSSNETLRRRFICIATHLFVRQDSRIRVAPLTACRPNHISVCL